MKDARALAYCNLFAILGSIPTLVELDSEAKKLIEGKKISIGFNVKEGPQGTISFADGKAEMKEGLKGSSIILYFSSCEKFNNFIDGKAMPLPTKGLFKLGFLLNNFQKLTDVLTKYLRPSEEDLKDDKFFKLSTMLMLHVIAGAITQLGNHDKVSMFSASNIVDGDVHLSIGDEVVVGVRAKDHVLSTLHTVSEPYFSKMIFADFETARNLFDGKINSLVAIGEGKVRVFGMIAQLDNVNRILDRVAIYLA